MFGEKRLFYKGRGNVLGIKSEITGSRIADGFWRNEVDRLVDAVRKLKARTTSLFAAAIPSFEGKTTLCQLFPDIFTDGDIALRRSGRTNFEALLKKAEETGEWEAVQQVHRDNSEEFPGQLCYLTWNKGAIGKSHKWIGSYLLSTAAYNAPVGRPNSANRDAILAWDTEVFVAKTHDQRNAILLRNLIENIEREIQVEESVCENFRSLLRQLEVVCSELGASSVKEVLRGNCTEFDYVDVTIGTMCNNFIRVNGILGLMLLLKVGYRRANPLKTITHEVYELLRQANLNRRMSEFFASKISALYEGHIPDWLVRRVYLYNTSYYTDFVSQCRKKYAVETDFGLWCYDRVTCVGERVEPSLALRASAAIARGDVSGLGDLLNKLFPPTEATLRARERLNPRSMACVLVEWHKRRILTSAKWHEIAVETRGLGWQGHAIVVLWYALTAAKWRDPIFMMMKKWHIFSSGVQYAVKLLKEIHDKSRRSQAVHPELPSVPWTQLVYLNMAVGRFWHLNVLDYNTVPSRAEPLPPVQGYNRRQGWCNEAFCTIRDMYYDELMATVDREMSSSGLTHIDNWLLRYLQYGSSGSAGKLSKEIDFGGSYGAPDRAVAKRVWLAYQKPTDVYKLLFLTKPVMEGDTADKRELGKVRALLPSKVPHWLAESICLNEIEPALFKQFDEIVLERTPDAELRFVNRRRRALRQGKRVMDTDYADFNYTHRHEDMIEFYNRLEQCFSKNAVMLNTPFGLGLSKSAWYKQAAYWCRESFSESWLADSGRTLSTGVRQPIKQRQGLWSGWRSTQFFNTLFNLLYFKVAIDAHKEMCFPSSFTNQFEVCGDDSDAQHENGLDCLLGAALLTRQGHELNAGKQLIDGDVAELLRVFYFRDGTMLNSLNRSLGSFVGGDLQTPVAYSSPEYVSGTNMACSGLLNRGANAHATEVMRLVLCRFWGTFDCEKYGRVVPSDAVLCASLSSGGFGITLNSRTPEDVPGKHWPEPEEIKGLEKPYGVGQLISYIDKRVHFVGMILTERERVEDALVTATIGSDAPVAIRQDLTNRINEKWAEHVLKMNARLMFKPDKPVKAEVSVSPATFLEDIVNAVDYYSDYNPEQLANTIRALALGYASSGDVALNNIAARSLGMQKPEMIVALASLSDANKAVNTYAKLRSAVGFHSDRLLQHKLHISFDTANRVPAALRVYMHAYVRAVVVPLMHKDEKILEGAIKEALNVFSREYVKKCSSLFRL
ncbi:putative RNA-dependent RNA polymerase [Rhizoctonia solani RNA virus HN008]|uniref:putative RNA-dependent RNA polymerase n=1 Tax=Rhizoctonia solani RNA virus HN008 TaxID=1678208 RepID=UPI00066E2FF0|nr:putative RNA-dependent RNA polymerase [Rhizoctonia solani RNA virus HN008]AKO82515.1 putative RNA-dependent RNA polymerase [Rhizoctonia solani RNA virus HN008]